MDIFYGKIGVKM